MNNEISQHNSSFTSLTLAAIGFQKLVDENDELLKVKLKHLGDLKVKYSKPELRWRRDSYGAVKDDTLEKLKVKRATRAF